MLIDDLTGTLNTSDLAALQGARSALDVKIVIMNAPSKGALDAQVGRMVTSANTLAIGVDPIHRSRSVHFGTGTGINPADYQTVGKSGDAEFKQGNWAAGLQAIVANGNALSVRSESKATIVQPTTIIEQPVSVAPFVAGGIAFVLATIGIMMWLRRRTRQQEAVLNRFRDEAAEMTSRNIKEQAWADGISAKTNPRAIGAPIGPLPAAPLTSDTARINYQPAPVSVSARKPGSPPKPAPAGRSNASRNYPAPREVHHHHGSDNSLLTGIVIGEALARPAPAPFFAPEPAPAPRQRSYTPPSTPSYSSSSDYASSSSSYDSGSSGGSFDSGSSFDGGSSSGDF